MEGDESAFDPRHSAVLAYLLGAITGVLALWLWRRQPYVRFHAWQSILFTVTVGAVLVAFDAVPLIGPGLVWAAGLLGGIAWGILLVQAYRRRWFLLPLIGDIALERARTTRS